MMFSFGKNPYNIYFMLHSPRRKIPPYTLHWGGKNKKKIKVQQFSIFFYPNSQIKDNKMYCNKSSSLS